MSEGKTFFEEFKEWEKSAPSNFKEEYMEPLKNEGTKLGEINLGKYAEGMDLVREQFLNSIG